MTVTCYEILSANRKRLKFISETKLKKRFCRKRQKTLRVRNGVGIVVHCVR